MTGLETTRDRYLRWATAIALVGAVHCGAAAWALRGPPEDDWESQTGGAFIVELSPITTSFDEERRDVAVGQKSEEVAPVAASAPQVASSGEPQPDEQPQLPETDAPPPEDAVAKRPDEKPPEELKPEVSAARAKDTPAVATVLPSEAAAPQRIENAAQTSDRPLGRNAGLSQIDRQAIENWQRDLVVHINRHKRYPAKAREARQYGVVSVAFALDREGRVVRASILKSTGYEALDQAAIEMLNRASPLPAPPASMPGETIGFVVPINYRWKD